MFLAVSLPAQGIFIEAESFASKGGWSVDQQFMDQMGSPYLIAHGMGRPVADASTTLIWPLSCLGPFLQLDFSMD